MTRSGFLAAAASAYEGRMQGRASAPPSLIYFKKSCRVQATVAVVWPAVEEYAKTCNPLPDPSDMARARRKVAAELGEIMSEVLRLGFLGAAQAMCRAYHEKKAIFC